jgi:hypothetical protein
VNIVMKLVLALLFPISLALPALGTIGSFMFMGHSHGEIGWILVGMVMFWASWIIPLIAFKKVVVDTDYRLND